ncbi:hypothetical protein [Mesorhizobium sp. M0488]|uniref:hypothetical protein n=1 Tax=unclassified Mesorhizobium TaxID=325217 RepID=UPI00333B4DA4
MSTPPSTKTPYSTNETALTATATKSTAPQGVIKATHPDFQYPPRWVEGSLGKPPEYAGTDFIIADDGKIAAVSLSLV